jgi:hypothetical protein
MMDGSVFFAMGLPNLGVAPVLAANSGCTSIETLSVN